MIKKSQFIYLFILFCLLMLFFLFFMQKQKDQHLEIHFSNSSDLKINSFYLIFYEINNDLDILNFERKIISRPLNELIFEKSEKEFTEFLNLQKEINQVINRPFKNKNNFSFFFQDNLYLKIFLSLEENQIAFSGPINLNEIKDQKGEILESFIYLYAIKKNSAINANNLILERAVLQPFTFNLFRGDF